ncbi:MAG: hypothetical protein SGJ19_27020 [Planctomycetia bacterium]|nr:hypothetical protein [Planctomycetia bacterium]
MHRTGKWVLDPHRRPLCGKENEIRRLHLRGASLSQLAERFHVSKVAIFKAVRRAEKNVPRGIRKRDCCIAESSDVAVRSAATLACASPDLPSPSEIKRRIGERIRRRRNTLRWSRAKLATALKLTARRIQVLETSGTGLTIGALFALSRVLDTPPWAFLGELPPPPEDTYGRRDRAILADFTEKRSTRKAREFLAAYNRIRNPAVRKQVRELVTLLAAE